MCQSVWVCEICVSASVSVSVYTLLVQNRAVLNSLASENTHKSVGL